MSFNFVDLNRATRDFMVKELEADISVGRVYISRRALPRTEPVYYDAQRVAFATGDTDSLNLAIAVSGMFAAVQSDGKNINVRAAAGSLGDGQFVAYYVRAICLRAIAEQRAIEIYRGRAALQPRPASEALIGTRPDPAALLNELRSNSLQPWNFTEVGKVNSGLLVKLV